MGVRPSLCLVQSARDRTWSRPRLDVMSNPTLSPPVSKRDGATVANRIQKVLEEANIKLGSVASDVLGVSGLRHDPGPHRR